MSDPKDMPSFAARCVIVSSYCIIAYQVFWACIFVRQHDRIRDAQDAWFLIGWVPCGAYVLLAALYYLMKGMPAGADERAILTLAKICAVSVIGGLFLCEVFYGS